MRDRTRTQQRQQPRQDDATTRPSGAPYRITVRGELDDQWSPWFDDLRISRDPNGDTALDGAVRDQAALHGVLGRVRDLGLELLAVEPGPSELLTSRPRSVGRSPVPAIAGAIIAGLALAIGFVFGPASGGSEATITGAALIAFGLGWGLMGLATRTSSQPQGWTLVPAAAFGLVGLGLIAMQPGAGAMDVLGWIWPPALAGLVAWMAVQVRRNLAGRGRWLIVPVLATLAAFAVGGGIASVTAAAGQGTAPLAGRLVDVGGRSLYIECHGTGSPVVVLQAGMGGTAADWSRVAGTVGSSTMVCAYDRAGHGWSDAAATPQDGIALATDLHTLLDRAGVAGPYVLVGHSSGGPYVRVFAARYPDEVAGMVLLDAQPVDAFTALPDYLGFYRVYGGVMTLAPSLGRTGLLAPMFGSPADPTGIRAAQGVRDELVALPDVLAQAGALTTIGDRPLFVLTAGSGQQAGWLDAQDRLVTLSANHAHRVISTATHDSLIVGDDAPASAQAILEVVHAVRDGSAVR